MDKAESMRSTRRIPFGTLWSEYSDNDDDDTIFPARPPSAAPSQAPPRQPPVLPKLPPPKATTPKPTTAKGFQDPTPPPRLQPQAGLGDWDILIPATVTWDAQIQPGRDAIQNILPVVLVKKLNPARIHVDYWPDDKKLAAPEIAELVCHTNRLQAFAVLQDWVAKAVVKNDTPDLLGFVTEFMRARAGRIRREIRAT